MRKLILTLSFASGIFLAGAQTEVLLDGGLEASSVGAPWASTSTNFGTVLCDANCGTCGGDCAPHGGSWYAWFGGSSNVEVGTLTQNFTVVNAGAATLSFWLKIPNAGTSADSISVLIDGGLVWHKLGDDTTGFETAYKQVTANVTNVATGTHVIQIRSNKTSGLTYNALVDDISLMIGGLAGVTDYDFENGITTYTNYDLQTLNFTFNFQQSSDVLVNVSDMSGRTMFVKQFNNMNQEIINISTAGWATGIYNVSFIKGGSVVTKKMFVK